MSNALQKIELALPVGSLETYVQAVSAIPMLSAAEERELAVRLRDHNDLDAARRLIMAHLRFVVHIARGYSGYGAGRYQRLIFPRSISSGNLRLPILCTGE